MSNDATEQKQIEEERMSLSASSLFAASAAAA
jgi:hypothetical protein